MHTGTHTAMEGTSPVTQQYREIRHDLTTSLWNCDIFPLILKHIAETYTGFHEFQSIIHACHYFRSVLKISAFKAISLDEPEPFDQVSREEGVRRLEKNKSIYDSFLRMLEDYLDIIPLIKSLSMCTVHTDIGLVETQFAIMRRCSPHLTDIRLNIQELYQANALWSVLIKVNPVSITLRGCPFPSRSKKPTWNTMDIFLVVQGCSNLRHLDITIGNGRTTPRDYYREGLDLELPLESLHIHNRFWHDADLLGLETVHLPNIKAFKGSVVIDDDSDRWRLVFVRCFTRHWVETLVDLDLSVSTVHRSRPNRIDIFDQVPRAELPKLKKLHVPVNLLRPRSLVALSTLEEVTYSDAGLSDLRELKSVLKELESSCTPLPCLKRFEMDNCTSDPGASEYLKYIHSVFEGRNVEFTIGANGSQN